MIVMRLSSSFETGTQLVVEVCFIAIVSSLYIIYHHSLWIVYVKRGNLSYDKTARTLSYVLC